MVIVGPGLVNVSSLGTILSISFFFSLSVGATGIFAFSLSNLHAQNDWSGLDAFLFYLCLSFWGCWIVLFSLSTSVDICSLHAAAATKAI